MTPASVRSVVAAPDKFRGTATAAAVAASICQAASTAGWQCDGVPLADGGEGTLEALGGAVRRTAVQDPLGRIVEAEWRLRGDTAVIEMARASGLALLGGPEANDPLQASTFGTGQLIAAAVDGGARRVVVGLGGSATTDGGLGALTALQPHRRLRGVELIVACDVTTTFVDAAEVFAPQKGATAAQVALLRRRLERLAAVYQRDHGVDVRDLAGAGAAGGLAGGLAAVGGEIVPGFEVVADAVDLEIRIDVADLIITGEGFLDEQSFQGKVVGGVVEMAREARRPVVVVVGDVEPGLDLPPGLEVISLVERFGPERATSDVLACVQEVAGERLLLAAGQE